MVAFGLVFLISFSYKFFVIYCIMAPFAALINYLLHRKSIKEAAKELNIHWLILMISFVWCTIFWINEIIGQTRYDLGLEEKKVDNV